MPHNVSTSAWPGLSLSWDLDYSWTSGGEVCGNQFGLLAGMSGDEVLNQTGSHCLATDKLKMSQHFLTRSRNCYIQGIDCVFPWLSLWSNWMELPRNPFYSSNPFCFKIIKGEPVSIYYTLWYHKDFSLSLLMPKALSSRPRVKARAPP